MTPVLFPQVIRKMGQYLKMSVVVPEEYLQGFTKADNTFLYQLVFDPLQRKVVPLNPYPEHLDPATLSYAGLYPSDCLTVCLSVCHIMQRNSVKEVTRTTFSTLEYQSVYSL